MSGKTSSKPSSHVSTVVYYIGANVERLRLTRGWKQVELADAAGLHLRSIQVLETRTANPTVRVLIDVADALGVAPTDLFAVVEAEPRRGRGYRPGPKK